MLSHSSSRTRADHRKMQTGNSIPMLRNATLSQMECMDYAIPHAIGPGLQRN